MKKFNVHKISRYGAALALCLGFVFYPLTPVQAETYYEKNTIEVLGKGIVFESSQMVTDKGMLDVYVLRVPLNDPYITVKPVQSTKESMLKEATTALLNDNNAIAGVNGDFFNMSGSYSSVIGPVVIDGEVRALDRMANIDGNYYASLILSKDGNPFIDYVKSEIHFKNDGVENIQVYNMNKITDMVYSAYIDHTFMADTSAVDKQFPGVSKIVVENDVITYVSQKGERVNVPQNGYVILISEASSDYFTSLVKVGQKADISITSTVDFNQVEQAIGGAGRLLINGQVASDGGMVPGGSQPRTAVGFTQDKKELILMVVDGRTHSIGATHQQLANLMLKYGAFSAMHLDGGGSSAMGVQRVGEDQVKLVNTPSDGSQRKVANALGVFSEAPVGAAQSVMVKPQAQRVFVGTGVPVQLLALDTYLNTMPLDITQASLAFNDSGASYRDGIFYPSTTGMIDMTIMVNGIQGQGRVESKPLGQIVPSQTTINAGLNGRTNLTFTGKSPDGFEGPIYAGMNVTVTPATLGHMEGHTFVADSLGAGYITVSAGNAVAYIDVNVGYQTVALTGFEDRPPVTFASYPDGLTGSVMHNNTVVNEGANAVSMTYTLAASTETQAAYITFPQTIPMPNGTSSFKLDIFGDNSYYWLRAKVRDGNGQEQTIDLAKEINWTGWKTVTANIPADMKQPVQLERIYVTSLNNIDTNTYTLAIDNVICDVLTRYPKLQHPDSSVVTDPRKADLTAVPTDNHDYYVKGDLAIEGYKVTDTGALTVIQMSAKAGGFASTNPAQWGAFERDIRNSARQVVVIETDISPINFTYAKEYQMFQEALEPFVLEGKTIFVVSTNGKAPSTNLRNGVYYVNLGGPWPTAEAAAKDGKEKYQLRLRLAPEGTYYQLQKAE